MPLGFKIDIPARVNTILTIPTNAGYSSYIVGGCVRDFFFGKEPSDWDICTSATPEKVCRLMGLYDIKTIDTGLQHGTVTAHLHGENYEITTFRADDKYSDGRHPDRVTFVGDIIEDLSRRDFTINAMAYSDTSGLIDPWGGYGDLWDGIIRCVRNPDDRFREDALRIMRALRFASTYGFKIEEKTAAAIHRNKHRLNNISAERIRDELSKMLCGKGALDILLEYSDVMAVIIPELEPCIGFDQNNKYHIYTVYDHIVHAVANYRGNDISVKMALLLHDIGKPECYTEDENGGHFHGHSVPSAYHAQVITDRLRFDNKTKDEIIKLVLYHDSDIQPQPRAVKRWLNKIGFDLFEKLMDVRFADINAHSEINRISRIDKYMMVLDVAKEVVKQEQCFTLKDLAINGYVIMELGAEGPAVGKVLNHLLDKVLDEEIENECDALVDEAKRYLKGETK